ncbi:hypothetical protein P4G95_06295 [Burkholderia vietnamiensis]|uniref:hypothetical protein n=1 Tax=Burkholderia vietnamiensis TaxID=60552 RepID=UPI0015936789|nr:hypothetical protein [Burkholderia vietnamiensis]WHU93349.1 hypothetical protein P4G95_06295 [Burkholderia vietnamiensis]CAJ5815335.1 Uncharacterised protein [Burkholderia pseudomallei]HDR9164149.1 hypothetical protein [Burkholderia vietnamiensis]
MKKSFYLIVLVLAVASIIGLAIGILVELDRLLFSGARSGIPWIAASLPGLVITITSLRWLGSYVTAKLRQQVQRVAPAGFHPAVEASAPTEGQYVGISPEAGSVVVIDKKNGVAKQLPICKVSRWEFDDAERGKTYLILWFNDHALPSTRVLVPRRSIDDTASRLQMALGF